MAYRVAAIDVHKRMLAVVVADVAVETEYVFERRLVGTTPDQLRALAAWFIECEVEEVVMESTAQYWRPVWETLERDWQSVRRGDPTRHRPRARCIWRKRSRTMGRAAGRKTFPMRNGS